MLRPQDFFDLSKFAHAALFDGVEFVWEVLPRIGEYIRAHLEPGIEGEVSRLAEVAADVYIGPGTVVEPGAMIKGPTIIGANCQVRQGAYIRGNVLVGDGAVLGHVNEMKNCVLMDEANAPHFAYIGDSVLGWRAHLGAGVKISNLKVTRELVTVTIGVRKVETGLRKFGAIIGDEAEIGCNSVLNPGTLVGKRALAYANSSLFGTYPPDAIIKVRQTHHVIEREER
ncbi:MAG: UDP-N-acetylglucosamine diphosphorylase [Chloroflexi bacterium]|nr:UDP-N-acetylglucosamine diphosphorylase [Chloroflexota bacterium]